MVVFLNDLPPYMLVGTEQAPIAISLSSLVAIVKAANDAVLRVYHDDQVNWDLEIKDDASPLTLADRHAHEIIKTGLTTSFPPAIGLISEEDGGARQPYATRRDWQYAWLVDPLDGTKEFLKKNGEFTVNIGLQCRGKVVGGVVSVPARGDCYLGFEGLGAWKCTLDDDLNPELTPIRCNEFQWTDPGLVVIGSRSHGVSRSDLLLNSLSPDYVHEICGSSLKMLAVAEGRAHIYPRFAPCCEWDTCAAHGVLKEAGGQIYRVEESDLSVGDELVYNKENLLNPFFLCVGSIPGAGIPKKFD